MTAADKERERIQAVAKMLRAAEKPVRVLRRIAWPPEVRQRFFEHGERELPQGVRYHALDPAPTLEAVGEARRRIRKEGVVDAWLSRQADSIEHSARMMAAVGTPELLRFSIDLYGQPTSPLVDATTTSLELAQQLARVLSRFDRIELGAPAAACHLAHDVARTMRQAVQEQFGSEAPEVVVVDHLSANALAGPRAIRLLRTACFSDLDVHQLIEHEALVHVATALNGRAQKHLPVLAAGHPGTTRTQEGLAVFAEFISGMLDPDRLRRLADRVLAIQMAIDGADFREVYRFFLDRTHSAEQAFESTRRVFRGGVLSGRYPFTKDVVYLDGLLRVHNFLRAVVHAGRTDCMRLLFCGKLDIEDIPALCELSHRGLCVMPKYLPPWVKDARFLIAYLAYSSFLNRVHLSRVRKHYDALLAEAPEVPFGTMQ